MSRHRAVSDTLGFIFVFSLVLSTVAVVSAVGMGGLQDTRDVERINNAERAFDILDDNMDDISRRGAPSRATEIKLADARLTFDDPVSISVRWEGNGKNGTNVTTTQPIVYTADDSDERLIYSYGGVFRGTDDSMTFVQEPSFTLRSDSVLVSAFEVRQATDSVSSVGGSGTFLVRASRSRSRLTTARTDGPYTVTINVSSPRASIWKSELESYDDVDSCSLVNSSFTTCQLTGVDDVRVVKTGVDVSFVD
ncbi:DUF7289 family protein [Haloferax larsenii]|uniref:Flagellin N-terminal-like domain-containing protein n=1 Tax=Haloferax larsenii TaxID=302484 RepID=A0A1H7I7T2_HALLR|nr:hypothetical protein [Haloferax larsenii]SEK58566.1 hypothetical protein SAMN04488691_101811 [Haloferax larsenii]